MALRLGIMIDRYNNHASRGRTVLLSVTPSLDGQLFVVVVSDSKDLLIPVFGKLALSGSLAKLLKTSAGPRTDTALD